MANFKIETPKGEITLRGLRYIGEGVFTIAYARREPRGRVVYLFTYYNDNSKDVLIGLHKQSKHLPKIEYFGIHVNRNGNKEKVYKMPYYKDLTFSKRNKRLTKIVEEMYMSISHDDNTFLRSCREVATPSMYRALRILRKKKGKDLCWDIHSDNVGMHKGVLIFRDPLCPSSCKE